MQTKDQLEDFYKKADPWGYQTNIADVNRKNIILQETNDLAAKHGIFNTALDIGAGEGWITSGLPSKNIYGYELSDLAASRFPDNVKRMTKEEISGQKFDLIIATGVLYKQYDYRWILNTIMKRAGGFVVSCNIKNLEINDLPFRIKTYEFPYRQYIERLSIYDFRPSQRKRP